MAAALSARHLLTRLRQIPSPAVLQQGKCSYFRQPSASFCSSTKERASADGESEAVASSSSTSSSWLQKLKGLWSGTKGSAADQPPEPLVRSPPVTSSEQDFDLATFADQLKKARQFGKLTQFGRGLPKGGEAVAQRSLERQEEILRKLATYSSDGQRLTKQQKGEVATQCSCTIRDVEDVLGKYEWTREANRRIIKLKEEGKPLPKSLDEIEKLMGGRWKPSASVNLSKDSGGQHSRNSPCPCGSGKKYKRCCGKD